MTRTPNRKLIAVGIAAAACVIALRAKQAQAQTDCAVPVTAPSGGFAAVNQYAGQQVPYIRIEFTAYGEDASYACISNYQDFPGPDPQTGNPRYTCFPLPGNGGNTSELWLISDGYSTDKQVYVQYNRCQAPQPATVNPLVTIHTSYWPEMCDEVLTGVFQAAVDGGPTVTSPEVQLRFTEYGNATFVKASNSPIFPEPETMTLYLTSGFHGPITWTIANQGANTIYVKYFNTCRSEATSQSANVTVYYMGTSCQSSVLPSWFGLGSATGNNNVVGPNVTLALSNGIPDGLMRISNSQNLSTAPYIPYATSLAWTLPPTKGSHTVWGQACTACGKCGYMTSYTFVEK